MITTSASLYIRKAWQTLLSEKNAVEKWTDIVSCFQIADYWQVEVTIISLTSDFNVLDFPVVLGNNKDVSFQDHDLAKNTLWKSPFMKYITFAVGDY